MNSSKQAIGLRALRPCCLKSSVNRTALCRRLTFKSWEDASVFNANLWRIWKDCANFRVLWPPYKWRFCCFVTHILEILPFMESDLCGMGFRSLIVSARGSSDDSGSALLDLSLWELCFSQVSPLWELFPS